MSLGAYRGDDEEVREEEEGEDSGCYEAGDVESLVDDYGAEEGAGECADSGEESVEGEKFGACHAAVFFDAASDFGEG